MLSAADLNGASLLGANISDINLAGAALQAAIMPDGTSYEEFSRAIPLEKRE
nr:pentapeptide repeat-containing protein [Okeania sp. SIO3I5]